jgi:uncharacterized protein YaiL (DUF2058 family)
MADSLRDQLLALGFAKSKPAPQEHQQRRGKPPAKHERHDRKPSRPQAPASQPSREPDLAQAYAIRERAERAERERVQREAEAAARAKKERKAKLTALLSGKSLNDANAETPRHFPHGDKIRRVYVTPEQLPRLNRGELGIVQLAGRYLLVDRETALAAQAIAAEALVLLPDPNAPVEDDIPPDLVW